MVQHTYKPLDIGADKLLEFTKLIHKLGVTWGEHGVFSSRASWVASAGPIGYYAAICRTSDVDYIYEFQLSHSLASLCEVTTGNPKQLLDKALLEIVKLNGILTSVEYDLRQAGGA